MMKTIFFGIIPNPACEDFEEDGTFEISPFSVCVTDKETWENAHCCSDNIGHEVLDKLGEVGFGELEESIFEPQDANITKEQIHKMMTDLEFVHNEDFEKFMENTGE